MKSYKKILRNNIEAVFVAVVLAIVITNYGVQAYEIPSGSMENTLLIGDRILVEKVSYRFTEPKRGEVIVFKSPFEGPENLIKRVIGRPGDRLEIKNGQVHINGVPMDESSYIMRDRSVEHPGQPHVNDLGPIIIPNGKYFVMGDNRDNSYDSRFWGFLERDSIIGRAFIIYWSRDWDKSVPASLRWERFGHLLK